MRYYRRFELHKGNKEKFWEIRRDDKELFTREGNLQRKTDEKEPITKREEKRDYREAQIAYEREIQKKLNFGYVEVQNANPPSPPIEAKDIFLQSLDKVHELALTSAEATHLLNYMIDLEVFDKRAETLDISKWERRILRRTEYETFADVDSLGEEYCELFDLWLDKSQDSRAYNETAMIPTFKFTDPNYWIITEKECQQIIQSIQSTLEKKREDIDSNDKTPSKHFLLRESWLQFHLNAKATGGYQVIPCNIQFHSTKHGHRFFADTRWWNSIFNTLTSLDIWDDALPQYQERDFASIENMVINDALDEDGLEMEPQCLEDGQKHEISEELLTVAKEINEDYRALLAIRKPEVDHSEIHLIDGMVKWNTATLRKIVKTLDSMEPDVFEAELQDYHNEQLNMLTELECEESNIEISTQKVINEIINEAYALINSVYQNIHNSEEVILSEDSEEITNLFNPNDLTVLKEVVRVLNELYPNIQDAEFEEGVPETDIYTYRPSGLNDLMEEWITLLPDAGDCLDLLTTYQNFVETKQTLKDEYPSAREFLQEYLECEINFQIFESKIQKTRQTMLRMESDAPGKVLLYKFLDFSEPWIITENECNILVENLKNTEAAKLTIIKELISFFEKAAHCDGCTLVDINFH